MIADVDLSRALAAAVALSLLTISASPAFAADPAAAVTEAVPGGNFWASWGDGKAELSGYRLQLPRYGQPRAGTLVLIYVTEDFSDRLRVKADPGRHPPSDVYPVLKLNAIRKFQTGIYDYSVMTSVFARVDFAAGERPFPLRKLSLSSQEWCGQVYHQVLPLAPAAGAAATAWQSTSHSYFDGEADDQRTLLVPVGNAPVVAEDELPILLRSYVQRRELLAPGAQRSVTFLPSLMRARLLHQPLVFTTATISRLGTTLPLKTAAGEFLVTTYTVIIAGGDRGTFHFAARPPYQLVHYKWESGEEATLLGTTRLPYWQLHDRGHEALLQKLGLVVPGKNPPPPIPINSPSASP